MSKHRPKDDPRGPAICGWFTVHGDPCRSRVSVEMTPDGPRCLNHDPRRRSQLREMSIKGAQRSARVRKGRREADAEELWADWPLTDDQTGEQRGPLTPEDCQTLAAWVIEQVVKNRLSGNDAHEITVTINSWLRAHGQGELARRMREAEDIIRRLTAAAKRRSKGQNDREETE